ncbi:uncharacterized protein LOC131640322 [Vicia villosa]|uniref:uncharacterized protein LOC131640322 n=1 Tax=Vicia villosa TaxID=3911 RepID=UPI00273C085D|nr:uncharacterized protein LOC131640322 [Vicia villosa]
MIIISWNCRGLSNLSAVSNLRHIDQKHRPDVIFLSETLATARRLEALRVSLKFDSCLAIDVEGRSGGLAVLWQNKIKCSVFNYSRNFINLEIEDEVRGNWRLTCYYGFPERNRRHLAWDMLRALRDMSSDPWCIIGDFNDLMSQEDKRGLHPHPNSLCNGFCSAVEDCGLSDINIKGHRFTWARSRGTPNMVEEQLDRAMANLSWLGRFPNVELLNILASHLDHTPILLNCDLASSNKRTYSFKFENQWLLEEDIKETISIGWNTSSNAELGDKLNSCAGELKRWSRGKRTRFKEDVKACEDAIEG